MTLFAQWIPNATDTITFNTQGGSAVANVSGLDGTTFTLPGGPDPEPATPLPAGSPPPAVARP